MEVHARVASAPHGEAEGLVAGMDRLALGCVVMVPRRFGVIRG